MLESCVYLLFNGIITYYLHWSESDLFHFGVEIFSNSDTWSYKLGLFCPTYGLMGIVIRTLPNVSFETRNIFIGVTTGLFILEWHALWCKDRKSEFCIVGITLCFLTKTFPNTLQSSRLGEASLN